MEKVSIKTSDDVTLSADYYAVDSPTAAIAYFHMMPATKESWRDLAEYLAGRGIAGLAVDLRGHGASFGGPLGYKSFSPGEHQAGILDIDAVLHFLHGQALGITPDKVTLMGASIGANLTLKFLAVHNEYRKAVLFSPGLNYHGIEAGPLVKSFTNGRKIFFIASHGDFAGGSDNGDQNLALAYAVPEGSEKLVKIYSGAGHGTDILSADPELKKEIFEFVIS